MGEVRKIYPNQFVKLEILKSHDIGDKKIIDDMAIINPVEDKNATNELLECRGNKIVYHTNNKNIELTIRRRIGLRGVL